MVVTSAGRRYGGLAPDERRAARRRRLLDAGLELFGSLGYAATSIEELCATARVTARHFYEEFPSREDLLRAVADEVVELALSRLQGALAETPEDPVQRVRAGVNAFVSVMLDDPRRARVCLLESVGVSRDLEAHRREVMEMFAEVTRREAERLAGRGLVPESDFRLAALALVGATNELLVHWLCSPNPPEPEQIVHEIARLFIAVTAAPA